ncbi:ER membrane protein complex subunit 10-like [Uloborus diversus]|uniref:ER membrane protein complex subunit 10-like n=1 Tax=Uloborus diversus TaxID=327109 RepID=UPI00240931F5|nr:ER membrane protein complex subunit 10-like [Uloborus diversus]
MLVNRIQKFVLFVVAYSVQIATSASNFPSKPDLQTKLLELDELDGLVTLFVHHSLEPSNSPPVYVQRGVITVHTSRNEAIYSEGKLFSTAEVEKLKKLAVTDDIYRIKISTKADDPDSSSVSSFTKACAVYESSLTDVLTVALDQSGVPVGVGISASPPYCYGSSPSSSRITSFNTTVNVVSLVNAPVPDTLTYIQRLEQEKAEKARGEQGDNRSFFAKYWMYIVPFVIFLFISGASGPEGQGAGR